VGGICGNAIRACYFGRLRHSEAPREAAGTRVVTRIALNGGGKMDRVERNKPKGWFGSAICEISA
jgi:hypothetical protein